MPSTSDAASRRGLPVRWHLTALAVGAALPALVLAGLLGVRLVQDERRALEARIVDRARWLSQGIDLEMDSSFRVLDALAQSVHLDPGGELARFEAEGRRVLATEPTWRAVVLHGLDGRILFHTGRTTTDTGFVIDRVSFDAVLAARRPVVGGLHGQPGGGLGFPLRVPVQRGGAPRYVLSAILSPESMGALLASDPAAEEFTRSLVDGRGVVVARTRDPARFVGQPSSPAFRDQVSLVPPDGGALFPSVTLEEVSAYAAVHRSPVSGWVTCVVLPASAIEGPARRTAFVLALTTLGFVLAGGGGALLLGRRLSRAFVQAAEGAVALAHGRVPEVPASSVREVMELRAALLRSSALLGAREAERDENLRQARAAGQAKDEFLAMLGHELRNPLAPISAALELLERRGEGRAETEVIARHTRYLTRLVDDLLDVSRVTRGTLTIQARPVRLGEVMASALEQAGPLIEERRHALDVELTPTDLSVMGDPSRLAQVVTNLLGNAAKYTPPGGRLRVLGRRAGAEVELEVSDDGAGIAPDMLPRIFDAFVQGPRAVDRQEGGLGLGLTIVRSIVLAHGGQVEARSDGPGKGSVFTVRLPFAEPPPPPSSAPPAPPAAPARTGQRVLVVDDNVEAAELLSELLRLEGHDAVAAYDGPTALAAAERERFDAAILDIGLPRMDGYELARRLRALPAGPRRLVALTGYGQRKDVVAAGEAGFDAHFVKPADLTGLLAAIVA